jgi:hypothetical protein
MRQVLFGIVLVVVGWVPAAAASDTLRGSGYRQTAYVQGMLQGMSYVMLHYDWAGFQRWDACVRA